MKKTPQAHYDYRVETENLILMVKWVDSNVVTVGTNYDVITPIDGVENG